MAIIAFWGNVHGQAATTSNVVAASSMLSLEHGLKNLVTQTQFSHSTLEKIFFKEDSGQSFADSGIDALARLAKSQKLKPEVVQDYTVPVLIGNLDVLTGTSKPDIELFEEVYDVVTTIFEVAKTCYDMLLIDVHSGVRNELSQLVLNAADLVVVNLSQNINMLDRFFSKEDYPTALENKSHIILLSKYDPKSRYNVKAIKRRYNIKENIFTMPYNTNFFDATNGQNVIDFFMKNQNLKSKHENYYFMEELKKLTEWLVKWLEKTKELKMKGAV